jgi:hypothetical protein
MKYVCNEHGDWWSVEDTVYLYVLDLDTLSPEDLAVVKDHGIEDDKFEWMIKEFGTLVELEVNADV